MDLRIQKTYTSLNEAFLALLEERSYETITVGMLCERAMIRRTTFYSHFQDKEDYLRFFFESIRSEFEAYVYARVAEESPSARNEVIMWHLSNFMIEHENLVNNILKSNMLDKLFLIISDVIECGVHKSLIFAEKNEAETSRKNKTSTKGGKSRRETAERSVCVSAMPAEPSPFATYASGGICKYLQRWWVNGRKESELQEMIQINKQLLSFASEMPAA